MKVFLNPGHAPGGILDPGAINSITGTKEATVVYDIGILAVEYLRLAGVTTELCQSDSLAEVVMRSDAYAADVFVSIHCNSFVSSSARGTEVFHYPGSERGALLSECLQRQLVSTLGTVDRGVKSAGFYVLRYTAAVAALAELAFISNAEDERLLTERQDDFARALARGITDYAQRLA